MEKVKNVFLFLFLMTIKFIITSIFINPLFSFAFVLIMSLIYSLIIHNKSIHSILFLSIFEYLSIFMLARIETSFNITTVFTSLALFIISNLGIYTFLVFNLAKSTSFKSMNKESNVFIDEGIKRLESNDYDNALIEFENAIKTHKKNYLGYMGMCDTIIKSNKDKKRFEYYKKNAIKYAPRELKENIKKKYNNL